MTISATVKNDGSQPGILLEVQEFTIQGLHVCSADKKLASGESASITVHSGNYFSLREVGVPIEIPLVHPVPAVVDVPPESTAAPVQEPAGTATVDPAPIAEVDHSTAPQE